MIVWPIATVVAFGLLAGLLRLPLNDTPTGRLGAWAHFGTFLGITGAMFAGAVYLTSTGNETALLGYGMGVLFLVLARLTWLHFLRRRR